MKNKNYYVRSSKLSTKFLNKDKKKALYLILDEYKRLVQKFVDYFWLSENRLNLPKYCSSEIYNLFDSFLGSYLKQSAGKQALGIVKGTLEKQRKRLYVYEKLNSEGHYKKARKLKRIIDEVNISCPKVRNVEIELGGNPSVVRFEDPKNSKEFDTWLYVSLSQNLLHKIYLPLRKTKHFNKFINRGGKLASGCRISKDFITFTFQFEKQEIKKIENPKILGIDIGISNIISASNGFQSESLVEVQKKLARRKKGSKGFKRAQEERKNLINREINKLNLEGISVVKRENIKNLKKYKRNSRFMQAWIYRDIVDKLERYCEERNVSVQTISPTYTSQRCSECGFVLKSSRKGKLFKCATCGFTCDADLNASRNIALNLLGIGKKERLLQKNRKGFYWNVQGQELIVPDTDEK